MNYADLLSKIPDEIPRFEEYAAILEYDAGMKRIDAERNAYMRVMSERRKAAQKETIVKQELFGV